MKDLYREDLEKIRDICGMTTDEGFVMGVYGESKEGVNVTPIIYKITPRNAALAISRIGQEIWDNIDEAMKGVNNANSRE